jgi:hypothetical protein
VKPFVAAFLFFTVAIRVNDHEDENDKATAYQHDEDRAILPKLGDQGTKV